MDEISYISEKGVSKILGKALSTLRNERCRGVGIPYYKLGRSVKYRLDEVLQYAEARRVETDGGVVQRSAWRIGLLARRKSNGD
jgi:hypothetical protein